MLDASTLVPFVAHVSGRLRAAGPWSSRRSRALGRSERLVLALAPTQGAESWARRGGGHGAAHDWNRASPRQCAATSPDHCEQAQKHKRHNRALVIRCNHHEGGRCCVERWLGREGSIFSFPPSGGKHQRAFKKSAIVSCTVEPNTCSPRPPRPQKTAARPLRSSRP